MKQNTQLQKYKKTKKQFIITFIFVLASCFMLHASYVAHAQQAITLTVTPPFFSLNVSPGEFWQSSLKVVNTNPGDLPVYVTLENFESVGEEGHGRDDAVEFPLPWTFGERTVGVVADYNSKCQSADLKHGHPVTSVID